jgi:hypothetical protein
MGLINKILGGRGATDTRPTSSTQFAESQSQLPQDRTRSHNAPRRDLVRVVLRETMRQHGIPSDWLECRTLSVLTRKHISGMHVQFLVRKADQQLLPYVHAFQESFWDQILKMDPLARDWLFSVGWEFYGKAVQGFSPLPDPTSWKKDDTGPDTESMDIDTLPPEETEDDVTSDLQALQAVMSAPVELSGKLRDAKPREHKQA